MPTGMTEKRIHRTYSILDQTDQKISEIARETFRGKGQVIDLAIADLHQRIMAGEAEIENAQSDPSMTR